jgi:hypothetical protein
MQQLNQMEMLDVMKKKPKKWYSIYDFVLITGTTTNAVSVKFQSLLKWGFVESKYGKSKKVYSNKTRPYKVLLYRIKKG